MRIIPTTSRRMGQATSMTRPSIRNSFRYRRTSGTDGESGEPRLTSKIALLIKIQPQINTDGRRLKTESTPNRFSEKAAFICVPLRLKKFPHTLRDVHARNNGIAQRNAVAVMPGEKEVRRLGFEVVQQLAVFSVADVVLRNRSGPALGVCKYRLATNSEQLAQIRQRQIHQL